LSKIESAHILQLMLFALQTMHRVKNMALAIEHCPVPMSSQSAPAGLCLEMKSVMRYEPEIPLLA